MISDTLVDRYYYIFDSREHRALVMDRMTGDEFDWDDDVRASLASHVARQVEASGGEVDGLLRRFACWCAQQTRADASDPDTATGRLWAVACGVGQGESDASTLEPRPVASVRQSTLDAAVVASAVGLPRADPDAARLLTVHACTHPDALRAALDAAHMSERWAEFCATPSPHDAPAAVLTSVAPETAARRMRQRQVDWFLDRL